MKNNVLQTTLANRLQKRTMSRFASQSIILMDQNGLFKVSDAFYIHDPPLFFYRVAVLSRNHRINGVDLKKMSLRAKENP